MDADGSSLSERAAELLRVLGPHALADYYQENDVRYSLQSALYHLDRLVGFYREKCERFEQTHPDAIRGNTSEPRIYFEVDAVLGAARRVYETIRMVLWKHYAPAKTGRWKSIRSVESKVLPPDFNNVLQASWTNFGEKAAQYRDCIMHYAPLTDGQETCRMEKYGGRWGTTVKLPVNPKDKSRAKYDIENGPDALEYCHSLVAHLVGLCEAVGRQDVVAGHLANPPGYPPAAPG